MIWELSKKCRNESRACITVITALDCLDKNQMIDSQDMIAIDKSDKIMHSSASRVRV